MSCIVTLHSIDGRGSKPVVRGTEPGRPVDWAVKAWFIQDGEKHTHSATAKQETVAGRAAIQGDRQLEGCAGCALDCAKNNA